MDIWPRYEIRKKDNDTFDIFQNGKLLHHAVLWEQLDRCLQPYGVSKTDYETQLATTGQATFEKPIPGKAEQGYGSGRANNPKTAAD